MVKAKPVTSKKAAPAKKIVKRAPVAKKVAVAPPPVTPAVTTVPTDELIRDSFTMPKTEYAVLADLKRRLLQRSKAVKKSELLRAGVAALAAMTDAKLLAAVDRIPNLKTGRPKKDKAAKASKKRA